MAPEPRRPLPARVAPKRASSQPGLVAGPAKAGPRLLLLLVARAGLCVSWAARGAASPGAWRRMRLPESAAGLPAAMGPAVLQLLSVACLVFTLGMFGTGLSDLRQMFVTQSVENIQFLPFLTTDVNNLSWLSYGFLKGDWTLILVNAIGATLQTLYILVYFYFSPEKRAVLLKTTGLLGVLLLGYGYFNLLVPDVSTRLARLGLFCSLFTITMYLSPLADLAKIIQTRSTQCISFPLTVTTFLASASWTLYGLLLQDPYIAIPNVPGIITSVVRFWLFWHFPPDPNRTYKLLQA